MIHDEIRDTKQPEGERAAKRQNSIVHGCPAVGKKRSAKRGTGGYPTTDIVMTRFKCIRVYPATLQC